MTAPIPIRAGLPAGDGPKRAYKQMRHGLSNIARRVAFAALLDGKEDVLLEVYAAGIAHATALMERPE